jgi:hypothetical protein
MPAPTTATRRPISAPRSTRGSAGGSIRIRERCEARAVFDLADMRIEDHALDLEREPRGIQVVHLEHDDASRRTLAAVRRAVQREPDRTGLQLRPLVAVTMLEPQAEHVRVEGDGSIHVGDPEPHAIDRTDAHPPAPSSFASTITAALFAGTARLDCATAK